MSWKTLRDAAGRIIGVLAHSQTASGDKIVLRDPADRLLGTWKEGSGATRDAAGCRRRGDVPARGGLPMPAGTTAALGDAARS
jgi:hypothetical protein